LQALTTITVCPCYAETDREAAAAIATFLERGADVRVFLEEGVLKPGQDLAAKAREARLADIALLLFSRQSMPSRWPRAAWEAALVHEPATEGVRMAFARLDDCLPPAVLQPRFELAGLSTKGLRALKRWVRNAELSPAVELAAGLDALGVALADRAGVETVASPELARQFASAFRPDFDAVLHLEDCAHRSLAALAGDLATQLGLRLEGDPESNLARLSEFCSSRRFLLVMEGAPPPALVFAGRSSTLIATDAPPASGLDELGKVQQAFGAAATWSDVSRLARQGRRLARDAGRLAECYELMEEWHGEAEESGDRAAIDESAREMVWILQAWGRTELAERLDCHRASLCDEQIPLPFGE
jgi:hypothetical protein